MDENKNLNQTPENNNADASLQEASVVKGKKPRNPVLKFLLRILSYVLVAVLAVTFTLHAVSKDNGNVKKTYLRVLINRYFDGEIDKEKMLEYELSGMVAGLDDPHSYYIPEEIGYEAFEESITGNYAGIGIQMMETEEGFLVDAVFPNTPAQKAGVQMGDYIVAVNGESAESHTIDWVSDKIRGEEGSEVTVDFDRDGKTVSFTMKRATVDTPTVTAEVLEGNIGYVKMTQFDASSHQELEQAMQDMKNVSGLILDLRDNPGGLFDVCMETLDPFLPECDMVVAQYKDEEKDVTRADAEVLYDMPMVVLINGNSASSSEIYAACMKDNERATIVGANSYGKGSIQTTFPLGDETAVNLTIGHFFSPKGNTIHKVGVKPDVEVEYEMPEGALYDTQLQAALDVLKK
ncbi:MAG: S41 family peptidase [Clostridia bacterium]|nr:S41 family peptidase [Clostridia bacterium]